MDNLKRTDLTGTGVLLSQTTPSPISPQKTVHKFYNIAYFFLVLSKKEENYTRLPFRYRLNNKSINFENFFSTTAPPGVMSP